ncbi:MAG TPA: CbiX/SirB N-terminal domain-containing protein [Opitutaceae bacterium]|nr:CbiX/SirB N-terminal domain-containing protein [Opitutaceae bacterium]
MNPPSTLLLDNGSLEPAATLRLRELAAALGARLGAPVAPVSLLHSSAITPDRLHGMAAEILEPALARRAGQGETEFVVVPLFFGPSRALTSYLPERLGHLRRKHPRLRVRLADPLFAPADDRLARILVDHVRATGGTSRVVVVDHGSPAREVTAVRDALAAQVSARLGAGVTVAAASMERRPEPEYDFCAPRLADLLGQPGWDRGEVALAMQFLLPGRHAGPDGDVAKICHAAEAAHPGLRTRLTRLVGEHPLLLEILADRWRAAAA